MYSIEVELGGVQYRGGVRGVQDRGLYLLE